MSLADRLLEAQRLGDPWQDMGPRGNPYDGMGDPSGYPVDQYTPEHPALFPSEPQNFWERVGSHGQPFPSHIQLRRHPGGLDIAAALLAGLSNAKASGGAQDLEGRRALNERASEAARTLNEHRWAAALESRKEHVASLAALQSDRDKAAVKLDSEGLPLLAGDLSGFPGKKAGDKVLPESLRARFPERYRSDSAGGMAVGLGANDLTDEELDLPAMLYLRTGQLAAGMGKEALAYRKRVIRRANAIKNNLGASGDIALNKAGLGADSKSLSAIQSNLDAVSAFENTAYRNMDQLVSRAEKVVDTGSPWANALARLVKNKAFGDEDVSNFNAALQPVQNEAAKILSSATLGGQPLSDRAVKDMQAVVGGNFTLKQLRGSLAVLRTDFENRRVAYSNQLQVIKDRMTWQRTASSPAQAAPAASGTGKNWTFDPKTGQMSPAGSP